MNRTLLAVAMVLVSVASGAAHEITITQRTGNDTVVTVERVNARGAVFVANIESSKGEVDSLIMDSNLSTLEWSRSYPHEGTELKGRREGRIVKVTGTFKNQPFALETDFGDLPWYQYQELSYPALAARRDPRAEFWTIGRADLKPTLFLSERQGSESLPVMGRPVQARRFYLTVHGVPALLFRSSFWIREGDGTFLRLAVPPVLGVPATLVELTSER
jgi:hypothetical protein